MSALTDETTILRTREAFEAYTQPIAHLLADPTVAEIMLNPASEPGATGQVWVDVDGVGLVDSGVTFTTAQAQLLMRHVGSQAKGEREFHDKNPVLSCQIVLDGTGSRGRYRFEGLDDPAVLTPAFTIRKYLKHDVRLSDYVGAGSLTQGKANALAQAARDGETVVLGGQTFSGKTTMLNALLHAAAAEGSRRLLIIEDTPELDRPPGPSIRIEVIPGSAFGYQEAVWSSLRQRPDAIALGEIRRADDAMQAIEAWNTGHQGFSTVHAPSCTGMLRRLYSLCRQSQSGSHVTQQTIADTVPLVVHLRRVKGRRVIDVQRVIDWDDASGRFRTMEVCDVED